MRRHVYSALIIALMATFPASAQQPASLRQVIALNGEWEVAEGGLGQLPDVYAHTVPVPGLIDMAQPEFEEVGQPSDLREAFWYRRSFVVEGEIPETAILKIHKAKYGSKVYLNGQPVGEHLPSFTPAYLDVKPFLQGDGKDNELIIRVGAGRESLPEGHPTGWDFEKYRYIPGIYDEVKLILTGEAYIENVQSVPDIRIGTVRFVIEVQGPDHPGTYAVSATVAEAGSGREVGHATGYATSAAGDRVAVADLSVYIDNVRLWSPEDPFLYEVHVETRDDGFSTRFGMRSFTFDPATKRALLNGKPYIMRGTNVTVYRFFEDDDRGDKPWRAEWVERLHNKFKDWDWNSIRYCIGFPPDFWYDIADEQGFLLQDEFPIWLLGDAPEDPRAAHIIPEYRAWMRERWNHPSVVIWDAQNESITEETGKAIAAVRHLDLSGRPWENGWAKPQSPADAVEAHPYLFSRGWQDDATPVFRLSEMPGVPRVPRLRDSQKAVPASIIINEYAWLWLTREGNPTSITSNFYERYFGGSSTVDERRYFYARSLAALTEFWRAYREAAGVLHFCSLAYSRRGDIPRPEGGATSDHFIDIESLEYEPYYEEYVRDAFSPVGLMLDFWDETISPGIESIFDIYVINDLPEEWEGNVTLRFMSGDQEIVSRSVATRVEPLGREILQIPVPVPAEEGGYTLSAELVNPRGNRVRSLRDVTVERE